MFQKDGDVMLDNRLVGVMEDKIFVNIHREISKAKAN
jgi:hypothetical protein